MFNVGRRGDRAPLLRCRIGVRSTDLVAGVDQERPRSPPRENLMKACGDKWRAVREAKTAKGVTWPQFFPVPCEAAAGATGPSRRPIKPSFRPGRRHINRCHIDRFCDVDAGRRATTRAPARGGRCRAGAGVSAGHCCPARLRAPGA